MKHDRTALEMLAHMFDVEMRYIKQDSDDLNLLAQAFHPEVVIHEPSSLPYAGEWIGLPKLGELFRTMRETWIDMSVEGLTAARDGDNIFMACILTLTGRRNGKTIRQPFAESLRFKEGLLIEGTPFYHDTAEILAALNARPGE
jgi:hypothetical protein